MLWLSLTIGQPMLQLYLTFEDVKLYEVKISSLCVTLKNRALLKNNFLKQNEVYGSSTNEMEMEDYCPCYKT